MTGLATRRLTFRAENGEEHLSRHFASVRRRDLIAAVTFADADMVRRYVGSSELGRPYVDNVPDFAGPFVSTKHVAVFLAEKAR